MQMTRASASPYPRLARKLRKSEEVMWWSQIAELNYLSPATHYYISRHFARTEVMQQFQKFGLCSDGRADFRM